MISPLGFASLRGTPPMTSLLRFASLRGTALALALCAATLAGCASLGVGGAPIEVQLVSLTPLPSTAFEHRLRVDLRLHNPSNRAYEIEGLRFVLDVNGNRLASGVSNERATLPRLGEVVVPVTTTTSLFDVVNQIIAFGQQPQPQFSYDLRGKIFLAGLWGSLPFQRKGSDKDLIARPRVPQPENGGATN
jgi:LEA14-like dessication related protein